MRAGRGIRWLPASLSRSAQPPVTSSFPYPMGSHFRPRRLGTRRTGNGTPHQRALASVGSGSNRNDAHSIWRKLRCKRRRPDQKPPRPFVLRFRHERTSRIHPPQPFELRDAVIPACKLACHFDGESDTVKSTYGLLESFSARRSAACDSEIGCLGNSQEDGLMGRRVIRLVDLVKIELRDGSACRIGLHVHSIIRRAGRFLTVFAVFMPVGGFPRAPLPRLWAWPRTSGETSPRMRWVAGSRSRRQPA